MWPELSGSVVTPDEIYAWMVEQPGGEFRKVTLPRPELGSNEVMIRISASGINPLDPETRAAKAPPHSSSFPRCSATILPGRSKMSDLKSRHSRLARSLRNGGRRRFVGNEGFDIVYDTIGGAALDASFAAVKRYSGHVPGCLGWARTYLAALSFRGATYLAVFTLLPLLTGEGRVRRRAILARISARGSGQTQAASQ